MSRSLCVAGIAAVTAGFACALTLAARPASIPPNVCHAADARSQFMLNQAIDWVTSTNPAVIDSRQRARVPVTSVSNIALVSDARICSKAQSAYVAFVQQNLPALAKPASPQLYVVKIGNVYLVSDPAFEVGEGWVQLVMDTKYAVLSHAQG